MYKDKNTDIVARYCAHFKYEDIPEDVKKITKQIFLDTIGIMLGSPELDKGEMGIKLAQQMGGNSDECTIVGTKLRTSAMAAAYANGELSHGLDADILMAPCHMASYMLSAVLAAAETIPPRWVAQSSSFPFIDPTSLSPPLKKGLIVPISKLSHAQPIQYLR